MAVPPARHRSCTCVCMEEVVRAVVVTWTCHDSCRATQQWRAPIHCWPSLELARDPRKIYITSTCMRSWSWGPNSLAQSTDARAVTADRSLEWQRTRLRDTLGMSSQVTLNVDLRMHQVWLKSEPPNRSMSGGDSSGRAGPKTQYRCGFPRSVEVVCNYSVASGHSGPTSWENGHFPGLVCRNSDPKEPTVAEYGVLLCWGHAHRGPSCRRRGRWHRWCCRGRCRTGTARCRQRSSPEGTSPCRRSRPPRVRPAASHSAPARDVGTSVA